MGLAQEDLAIGRAVAPPTEVDALGESDFVEPACLFFDVFVHLNLEDWRRTNSASR